MKRTILLILLFLTASAFAQESPQEQAIWKLEHSYWEYVKAFDLTSYRALWDENFMGWPSWSPQPVAKSGISAWIDDYKKKGMHLDSYSVKPAGSRMHGDAVVAYYLVTTKWVDKDGKGQATSSRITHTWMKSGKDWKIVGGMSSMADNPK